MENAQEGKKIDWLKEIGSMFGVMGICAAVSGAFWFLLWLVWKIFSSFA